MSAHGAALLGAVRTNFVLLAEHEKIAPDEVARIVEAMASHLRSWRPLALLAADTGPTPRFDLSDATSTAIERTMADGQSYRIETVDDVRCLHAIETADDGSADRVVLAFSPSAWRLFLDDARSVR